jgi:hypothetical protein
VALHFSYFYLDAQEKGEPFMRPARNDSIRSIIESSVREVVARVSGSLDRAVAQMVGEELKKRPASPSNGRRAPERAARPRQRHEITRWVANRRARRVPTFVIEMTGGLDTKKKIVAKFGENAAFEKGKPPPKPARAA